MAYLFEEDEALEYGDREAILIQNFRFWIRRNKANGDNFHNEKTWTYNKIEAFEKLFKFWTKNQIRRLIDGLVNKNVLIKGNFNKNPHDRTCWYCFTDEIKFLREKPRNTENTDLANLPNADGRNPKSNWRNCQMQMAEIPNRIGEIAISIKRTDIKPDIKPDISLIPKILKHQKADEELNLWFDQLWKEFKPIADYKGNFGNKGSKPAAEKIFKNLVKDDKFHPVHIIWGARVYLKDRNGKQQNCHLSKFLKDQLFEEFIEAEEAVKKQENEDKKASDTKNDRKILTDDPFWIKSVEMLKNGIADEKWTKSLSDFQYCGIENEKHLIIAPSKFIRDWFRREYKDIFDKIFGKWNITSIEI